MKTCGTCKNGKFELTPTGRIKRGHHGHCAIQEHLAVPFNVKRAPPCLVLTPPHYTAVWPDYKADHCEGHVEK